MATLWIREYRDRATAGGGRDVQLVKEPGIDQTPVTFTTSTKSAAFGATTTFIGIIASEDFHYVVAEDPTATINALRIPANTLVHLGVNAGHKIAAILAA